MSTRKGKRPASAEERPSEKQAAQPVTGTLRQAIEQIDSDSKAEKVAAEVEASAPDKTAEEIARETPAPASAGEAARRVERAAQSAPPDQRAKEVLIEAAREVVAAEGEQREAVAEAVHAALNPEVQGRAGPDTEQRRDRLREAILRRMRPYDAVDARLFLAINHLPHTVTSNRFFYFFTYVFTGGAAWYALMWVLGLFYPRLGWRAVRESALPLAAATAIVEYPIKSYFRRKRPFITIVKAIVIGRKPGTWSFPSGHSASAFAGAWLLARCFPRLGAIFYTIAGLVAFSRIYLGDHYPGDVVSGSIAGVLLARWANGWQRKLWRAIHKK